MSRSELLQNASVFLADPKTQASPLAQRIQFLEAKGLTPEEIDLVVKQSASGSHQISYTPQYGPPQYRGQPPHLWDWRDYFIATVVTGSVAYGTVSLFKKYLLPHLQPPSSSAYEQDRDGLTAQFDAAEALLREIQAETASVRKAVDEQREQVEKTTQDVQKAVKDMNDGEVKTRDELREIREEVNNIREMLPKMIAKNKESQSQSLSELQQELKSLKVLLLTRGPSSGPSTPPPMLARPTIPSWQLAPSTPVASPDPTIPNSISSPIPAPTSSPIPMPAVSEHSAFGPPLPANGKGKEVEVTAEEPSNSSSS